MSIKLEEQESLSGPQALPSPFFSPDNPYWQADRWQFLNPGVRPKLSAIDFLHATTWEIWRPDPFMAWCVRDATIRTVRLNSVFGIRDDIKSLLLKKKGERDDA